MQISDLARQYQNTTAPTEMMNGTRGIEKLVSSVREMTVGNIFEGTVNAIQGGKVILGLSNGTELSARLDANMQLVRGQSMFFQVKSNNGETIAIRPYMVDGTGANPTLLHALKAANLPVSERYLNLANTMMQEQMPIDKNTMSQMARILMANPDMGVNTLVQMKKLNIPLTPEMTAQFENYTDDNHAVHKAMDQFISELPAVMAKADLPLEQLREFESNLLDLIKDGMEQILPDSAEVTAQTSQQEAASFLQQQETAQVPEETNPKVQPQDDIVQNMQALGKEVPETEYAKVEEQTVLTESRMEQTQDGWKAKITSIFGEIGMEKGDSAFSILSRLSDQIRNGDGITKESLQELFSSKEMQTFLKETLETQMYLKPDDVSDPDKVKKMYERLKTKTERIENLLLNAGLKDTPLAQTASNINGNIEFMNQLNQAYTYMQIPLKMNGQNASGELYVYTNKRDLADPERELTAFLHLDLDHLGSTDVSVRLLKKDVDTKFYMDSDEAYALVQANIPLLEERLKNKGFQAMIYVEKEGKKVNFVEDILKKETPSTGQVHRYSFDVRA